MNPVIRAQVKDYSKTNSLTAYPDDLRFEIYSIYSVLTGFLGEAVDAYDVHLLGTEFGLDGVAVLIQGEIVKNRAEAEEKLDAIKNPAIEFIFFQSKTSTSFDYGDISKFFDAIRGFFDGSLTGESDQLDDLMDAKDAIYERPLGKRNPKVNAYYITTGNYEEPKRIENLISSFKGELEEMNIFDQAGPYVSMIGAKQLQQWYRAATSSVEKEIEFAKNVVMPTNNQVEEAYIGYLPATELLKLYTINDIQGNVTSINKAVFVDNIRDYDPNSKINKQIKGSVKAGTGGDFVFRNNGITVVAKNIDRTGDKFRLEDYQIVNGCQTSNIIFDLRYMSKDENGNLNGEGLVNEINVPFRLIGSRKDDFISSIIVGTNRQNPVKEEQFWALRPFMKDLEEYSRSLDKEEVIYLERRENQYRGQDVERVRIMQPSVMMKAIAATVLFQPHRAARDYRGIIAEYQSALFLEDHDVRIYHAVCYLYYRLEFLWRNQRLDSSYKTFRYYILTGIGLRLTGGKDVFGLKKGKLHAICDSIIELAKDEDKLKSAIVKIVKVLEQRLSSQALTSQEKVRDAMRSDTFSSWFRSSISGDGHTD
jgi:hypothetical protein